MKNLNERQNLTEIRLILIGSGSDGKTAIIQRYIDNSFKNDFTATIGFDSKLKKVKMEDGIEVKVKVFDTAGQERFKSITWNYFKKVDGIIINYDITDKHSFDEGGKWMNQIKNDSSLREKVQFLVGNKNDLKEERVIPKEDGEKLAKKYGVMFSECSAKTGENIEFIFDELIKKIYPLAKKRSEEEEEKRRRKIGEEKTKKNLKILNKYLSF